MTFFFIFLALLALMQIYFFVASKYNIIDKPNNRSSHIVPTIRGGGIIFFISVVLWFFVEGFQSAYLVAGASLIALISFLDDIAEQPAVLRLVIHTIAFLLMGCELSLFANMSWWLMAIIFIIGIGTLNAFNFMDGINGMTGVYALTTLVTLAAINRWGVGFASERLILVLIISVLVFLIYNFRTKARCFAGDVGSITLAFLLIFLVLQLVIYSGNYGWIVLFAVYGIDSVITIIYRLLNRENIFKAHRTHVYQYLANELGYPHLAVSIAYGMVQLIINLFVVFYVPHPTFIQGIVLICTLGLVYVWAREWILSRINKPGLISYLSGVIKNRKRA